jgi:hypothetical protein
MASENASLTGLAVARATTLAEVQNREWSSRPVMTEHSVPSSSFTPPTTSICHSSMARERSQRRLSPRWRRRLEGSSSLWRTNAR